MAQKINKCWWTGRMLYQWALNVFDAQSSSRSITPEGFFSPPIRNRVLSDLLIIAIAIKTKAKELDGGNGYLLMYLTKTPNEHRKVTWGHVRGRWRRKAIGREGKKLAEFTAYANYVKKCENCSKINTVYCENITILEGFVAQNQLRMTILSLREKKYRERKVDDDAYD